VKQAVKQSSFHQELAPRQAAVLHTELSCTAVNALRTDFHFWIAHWKQAKEWVQYTRQSHLLVWPAAHTVPYTEVLEQDLSKGLASAGSAC
jgi:hypothetical protein